MATRTPDTRLVSSAKPKVSGAIYSAPIDTELPTTVDEELNEAFKNLGYISDNGISNEQKSSSKEEKAWGGQVVLSSLTERKDTFKYTLIESLNEYVLEEVYGSAAVKLTKAQYNETSDKIEVSVGAGELREHCIVIDIVVKDGLKRIVIPNGKVTEVGDVTYKDGDTVGYPITLGAYPDSKGNTHYEYIQRVKLDYS